MPLLYLYLKGYCMMLSIYYLCNSSISFAISVPILPAPRTVPEDIPGTFTKGCFTASTVKNQNKTPKQNTNLQRFHYAARNNHLKDSF